jgi:tRNA(fMet)-specific endonuclease VapC
MELCKGASDKKKMNQIAKSMQRYKVLHLNGKISLTALKLIQQYQLSHRIGIADALIAATAIELKLPLLTLNLKDFVELPGIKLYKPSGSV